MNLVEMSARGFNNTLYKRRVMYVSSAGSVKMAKDRLEKLQPTDGKLFGGKTGDPSKALKDEGELRGRTKFEPKRFSDQYSNYSGGQGTFRGMAKSSLKHKGSASRGRGSFSKKRDN